MRYSNKQNFLNIFIDLKSKRISSSYNLIIKYEKYLKVKNIIDIYIDVIGLFKYCTCLIPVYYSQYYSQYVIIFIS